MQPVICAMTSSVFVEFFNLEKPLEVVLGDGHVLEATGCVILTVNLPNDHMQNCKLHDVLYVPKLSYNLLSVSRATDSKKETNFSLTVTVSY